MHGDRRTFLRRACGTAIAASMGSVVPAKAFFTQTKKSFPAGFRWGVATAAHQVEGNNTNSDLWLLENIKPTTFADRSGDACDSLHRYEEDIALLAKLGFNTYRFSIEWARIEPNRGEISHAEMDYYKRVIDCCHRHNVSPAVTFFHVSEPLWFAKAGGWRNPESGEQFARYCSVASKALADGMTYAFTINEPQVAKSFRSIPGAAASFKQRDNAALQMLAAAARATGTERFVSMDDPDIEGMTPNLISGHEKGFAAIKAEAPRLPVGVTLNITDFEPMNEDSPFEQVREEAYGDWMEVVKRCGDFAGVQVYRTIPIPGKGKALPQPAPMPFLEGEANMMASFCRPEALRNAVKYVYGATRKPILVTENGLDTTNDERRVWYIDHALAGLQQSIASGVPVLGYVHWSLLDNFEWTQGYKPKYGLVAVDRQTFVRSPKPSAQHLGEIARRNAL